MQWRVYFTMILGREANIWLVPWRYSHTDKTLAGGSTCGRSESSVT
jgi:hypothetical protein